ncbi:20404_t:CDS:1, partial [Rhizophagus irregularis]
QEIDGKIGETLIEMLTCEIESKFGSTILQEIRMKNQNWD